MSSDIQTNLELLVLGNYVSLAGATIVVYDYIMTISREIEYVWLRPWTWVSTMFVVVRYIGLCWIMTIALDGSSFVPGPLEVSHVTPCSLTNDPIPTVVRTVIYLICGWALIMFLSATDFVMILRVYAMWNRSRTILSILVFLLGTQTMVAVILTGIYDNPNTHLSVTMGRVLNFSICRDSYINTPATLEVYPYLAAPRLILSVALVILAVSRTLKQSLEMYKATKQWQPNRYIQKLAGDGILYFIVNVVYQINYVLALVAPQTNNTTLFLTTFINIFFYILVPRFTIGIRELYDRDIRGRFHIDTGFGVRSRSNPGLDTTVPAMVFVGGNQGPDVEGGTDDSGDFELGAMHGSRLPEGSPRVIGDRE